ncbi:hypothetical protein PIB30_046966 [Stylosanthes scabra]|uniref:Uncharacterized protein n=1 Tax=Stylosanthes scabra TaxID=79078 RepID=A0ABU6SH45_9FABA|nr:hypothetical protein [Stylosanthes scabra]
MNITACKRSLGEHDLEVNVVNEEGVDLSYAEKGEGEGANPNGTHRDAENQIKWEIIAVHFSSADSLREQQFEDVLEVINQLGESHMLIGNFNSILAAHEKEGGGEKST